MIYTSHYYSKASRIARCFMISNSSFQCLKLSYARSFSFYRKTTGCSVAGPAVTRVILNLLAHFLIGNEDCISHTDTICIASSHVRRFLHSFKANIELLISFGSDCLPSHAPIRPHRSEYWEHQVDDPYMAIQGPTKYSFCK